MKKFKKIVYVGFNWHGGTPNLEGYSSPADPIKMYQVFRTEKDAKKAEFECIKKCRLEEI